MKYLLWLALKIPTLKVLANYFLIHNMQLKASASSGHIVRFELQYKTPIFISRSG